MPSLSSPLRHTIARNDDEYLVKEKVISKIRLWLFHYKILKTLCHGLNRFFRSYWNALTFCFSSGFSTDSQKFTACFHEASRQRFDTKISFILRLSIALTRVAEKFRCYRCWCEKMNDEPFCEQVLPSSCQKSISHQQRISWRWNREKLRQPW